MNKYYKFFIAFFSIILVLSVGVNVWLIKGGSAPSLANVSLVNTVSAAEIYPMFFCPCCGQPLDKKNICCEAAQERIDYIDSLAEKNLSENEIILEYVKKFGLNSFTDATKQEEFKAELAKSAPADRPIINIVSGSVDLGDVSQSKGITTTFFEIKNTGKRDLIIGKLDTSCGCTSAAIIYKGEEGPRFAMAGHGIESPSGWQVSIPPDQSAQLKVYYDPSVHPDLRGPVIREIYIFSNDPVEIEKKVQIELNQVD